MTTLGEQLSGKLDHLWPHLNVAAPALALPAGDDLTVTDDPMKKAMRQSLAGVPRAT
jgi:hypothetical protein